MRSRLQITGEVIIRFWREIDALSISMQITLASLAALTLAFPISRCHKTWDDILNLEDCVCNLLGSSFLVFLRRSHSRVARWWLRPNKLISVHAHSALVTSVSTLPWSSEATWWRMHQPHLLKISGWSWHTGELFSRPILVCLSRVEVDLMLWSTITCSRPHQVLSRFCPYIANHVFLCQLLPEWLKAIN